MIQIVLCTKVYFYLIFIFFLICLDFEIFHSEIFVSFNEFLSTLFSFFFSIGATSNGKSSGFVGLGLIFSFLINASLLFNISISKFEIFLPPGSFGLIIMFSLSGPKTINLSLSVS